MRHIREWDYRSTVIFSAVLLSWYGISDFLIISDYRIVVSRPRSIGLSDIGLAKNFRCPPLLECITIVLTTLLYKKLALLWQTGSCVLSMDFPPPLMQRIHYSDVRQIRWLTPPPPTTMHMLSSAIRIPHTLCILRIASDLSLFQFLCANFFCCLILEEGYFTINKCTSFTSNCYCVSYFVAANVICLNQLSVDTRQVSVRSLVFIILCKQLKILDFPVNLFLYFLHTYLWYPAWESYWFIKTDILPSGRGHLFVSYSHHLKRRRDLCL